MRVENDALTFQLTDCVVGLAGTFDSQIKRWHSEMEDDLFANYVAIWALSEFDLVGLSQAQGAAQWILNHRSPGSLKWTDSTGSKPIEMTNRALIGLILSGTCRSYQEIDLYVDWILNVQQEHGGAWIEETKHMGGQTSYGPTLPATFLLRLIRDKFNPEDKRIAVGLETTRDWLIRHYQENSIWNFQHKPGDVHPMAVTWAIRIYANCAHEPHKLQQDGVEILKKFLRDEGKIWTQDHYQLLYNCSHSLALCKVGLEDDLTASLAQWLIKQYEGYDFNDLSAEPEGVRKLCGMLISISRALKLSEEGRHVLVAVRERVQAMTGIERKGEPSGTVGWTAELGRDVFIVHGRDEAAKEKVARFIEKLGLTAIILHEQPNAGRTIIEKFEDYSNVSFAVVLLTPDDMGALKDELNGASPRARQNVIFELGYFIGKLGRNRTCALYKEDVEIPSDYQGVLWIPLDPAGAWKLKLAREIKNSGINVNLSGVV